jgi:hypothetical protein
MVAGELPNETLVKEVQPLKALEPIVSTLSPKLIASNLIAL